VALLDQQQRGVMEIIQYLAQLLLLEVAEEVVVEPLLLVAGC
jgi:hypothetical protein